MSGDTTIADVGETLIKLLRDGMSDLVTSSAIALQSPADLTGQTTRVTLFLCGIAENQHMRNQQPTYRSGDSIANQPLVVDLRYMLTVYSYVQDLTERSLEEHRLLGRAMRLLHDHASIGGSLLQGGLAGETTRLRILLESVPLSEMTELWSAFPGQAMRPSVFYTVSSATLESNIVTTPSRVAVRNVRYLTHSGEEG